MGKLATLGGVLASIGAAYLVRGFSSMMEYMQILFGFFNAPIFATFLLGMFWKRATPNGAFVGLACGIAAGVTHHVIKTLGYIHYSSNTAAAFYGAILSWSTCFFVTIGLSLITRPRPEGELVGLVYSLTERPRAHANWYARPSTFAIAVIVLMVGLNLFFF
jgi:SSS family solute:Na+ symporter